MLKLTLNSCSKYLYVSYIYKIIFLFQTDSKRPFNLYVCFDDNENTGFNNSFKKIIFCLLNINKNLLFICIVLFTKIGHYVT